MMGSPFFVGLKPSDALMLQRPDGKRWGKAHAQRPLAQACPAAHISPAASFHVLRHTYASHLVTAGAPLQVVAANLGHADTRVTEKHYAHLAPNYVADVIRATMPGLGLVESDETNGLISLPRRHESITSGSEVFSQLKARAAPHSRSGKAPFLIT